jgi:hypothetical protein
MDLAKGISSLGAVVVEGTLAAGARPVVLHLTETTRALRENFQMGTPGDQLSERSVFERSDAAKKSQKAAFLGRGQ